MYDIALQCMYYTSHLFGSCISACQSAWNQVEASSRGFIHLRGDGAIATLTREWWLLILEKTPVRHQPIQIS